MSPSSLRPAASPRGFTLLELILVMSLMAMLVGIGVASFASLERKEPLQEHVDALAKMSRQALRDAVMKHQGIQIAFEREGFSLGGAGGHQHGRRCGGRLLPALARREHDGPAL